MKVGQPAVFTAQIAGTARRLEWNLDGDAAPDLIADGYQTSVRFRPDRPAETVESPGDRRGWRVRLLLDADPG